MNATRSALSVSLVAALAFVLPAAASAPRTAASATAGAVVKTAYNAKLKTTILVNAAGMTLYEFESDYQGQPGCTNDSTYHCSKHWLPLLTAGMPRARGAAKQKLLGSVKRPDGKIQVSYKHRPVYTWRGGYGAPGDKKPGDVNGQGFGQLWYVLGPTGNVIKKQP